MVHGKPKHKRRTQYFVHRKFQLKYLGSILILVAVLIGVASSTVYFSVFDMLSEEGLCLGGSSGINVAGAVRLAKDLGPGKTIVTVLADYGTRYQSKLYNPDFLREKGLPVPEWLAAKAPDMPDVSE